MEEIPTNRAVCVGLLCMNLYREGSYPKVAQCDGSYEIRTEESPVLQWKIEGDDEGVAPSGGSMEFNCPDSDPDSFFPVSVDFISQNILSQVSVSKSFLPHLLSILIKTHLLLLLWCLCRSLKSPLLLGTSQSSSRVILCCRLRNTPSFNLLSSPYPSSLPSFPCLYVFELSFVGCLFLCLVLCCCVCVCMGRNR
jgi:hypothetical protein